MKKYLVYFLGMMMNVGFIIREKLKILNPVIRDYSINVVYNFIPFKIATNVLFHNKTVFKNISLRITKWMIPPFNINIALFMMRAPVLPIWMVNTHFFHSTYHESWVSFFSFAFTPTILSFVCFRHFLKYSLRINSSFSFIPRRMPKVRNAKFFSVRGRHNHSFIPGWFAFQAFPVTFLRTVFCCFDKARSYVKGFQANFALLICHKSPLILLVILASALTHVNPSYAVDEWSKTLSGSSYSADVDTNVSTSWAAQDRLLIGYRKNCALVYNSASTVDVLAGEVAIPNSDGSAVRYRRLTSTLNVPWSDLDTGVEANSTTYYVYLLGDTSSTAPTAKISTSSSAPSGATYYLKIGTFYNDSSGNITNVDSYRNDNGARYRDTVKGWINFNGSGTIAINDSYNVSSITDNGTGDYTITWTTGFQTTSYAISGSASSSCFVFPHTITTSSSRVNVYDYNGSATDASNINVIAIGD